MNLKDIALRNLLRRKAKAGFVLAGLVIGVSTVVALVGFGQGMAHHVNHNLERYGANILIVPRTENLSLSYGGLSLGGVSFDMQQIREDDLRRVGSIKNAANIAAVGPMVLGVVQVGERRVLMSGVDFGVARILKPWWKVSGTIPDDSGVLLGAESAAALNLSAGSTVRLGQRDFVVSGVLEPTGSQDDQMLFTSLSTAQEIHGLQGQISMAEVAALCKDCPIEEMVRQISEILPGAKVMAIQQVVQGRMETLMQFHKFSFGVSGVVILIGGLVVLVTMMGSVRERTEEIGIFRAIGFRKRHVMKIILLEAGFVSGLAGLLGYLIGFGGAWLGLRLFTGEAGASPPLALVLAVGALLLALTLGLASSIYPALLAARMDPNDALRSL